MKMHFLAIKCHWYVHNLLTTRAESLNATYFNGFTTYLHTSERTHLPRRPCPDILLWLPKLNFDHFPSGGAHEPPEGARRIKNYEGLLGQEICLWPMWQKVLHKKRLKTTQVQTLRNWTKSNCVSFKIWGYSIDQNQLCKMYFLTQLTQSVDFASIQLGKAENPLETIWDSKYWQNYWLANGIRIQLR